MFEINNSSILISSNTNVSNDSGEYLLTNKEIMLSNAF